MSDMTLLLIIIILLISKDSMKKGTDVAPQNNCRCYPSWITLTYLIYHILDKLTSKINSPAKRRC